MDILWVDAWGRACEQVFGREAAGVASQTAEDKLQMLRAACDRTYVATVIVSWKPYEGLFKSRVEAIEMNVFDQEQHGTTYGERAKWLSDLEISCTPKRQEAADKAAQRAADKEAKRVRAMGQEQLAEVKKVLEKIAVGAALQEGRRHVAAKIYGALNGGTLEELQALRGEVQARLVIFVMCVFQFVVFGLCS